MNIIFDKEKIASYGRRNDIRNTPEILVSRCEDKLKILGEFMNADSIEYRDYDKQEEYIIIRGKEKLILNVYGNQYDGGWLTIKN